MFMYPECWSENTVCVLHMCFSLLERVYAIPPKKGEALDPYSDDNKAPFYRQPAGIRRQKKRFEKEEAGKILIWSFSLWFVCYFAQQRIHLLQYTYRYTQKDVSDFIMERINIWMTTSRCVL